MSRMLDGEVADAAHELIDTCRISLAQHGVLYRSALRHRAELSAFFSRELGWEVEVSEVAGLIRLHKRRDVVPGDRGPWLVRSDRRGELAGKAELVLVALVCEQLWRRPRISLRELLQGVAQVCATESATGRLPAFRIVASDSTSRREAHRARGNVVDALKILEQDGEISTDADLDRAVDDESAEVFITADRERLTSKFAALSPTLLKLSDLPPDQHALALSAATLREADPAVRTDEAGGVDVRRLRAVRRVVDDPGADPADDLANLGYLSTPAGRERALNVAASLGLSPTVRSDWWQVGDGTAGAATAFPNGRRTERQAALALLAAIRDRSSPVAPLPLEEVVGILAGLRETMPRWAASYADKLTTLGRAAAADLTTAGLLRPTGPDRWTPTPGVHLWKPQVSFAGATSGRGRQRLGAAPADLFSTTFDADPPGSPDAEAAAQAGAEAGQGEEVS